MELSGDDVEDALFVVNILISELNRQKVPVDPAILEVADRFNIKSLMSSDGHQTDCPGAESESEFLPTGEAAEILGLSTRHLSRLATDLDGDKFGGRYWYFRRSTVIEYAKAREAGRGAAV